MSETMSATTPASQLEQNILTRTATVSVVGLGYVGLPLLRAFFKAGFPVLGYDVDQEKIDRLNKGESYLKHLGADFAMEMSKSDKFRVTTDAQKLADADVIILCVPTPLGEHGEPDMSYITRSTEMVAKVLRKGQLITLESTTYPGTTRGDCIPILAKTRARRSRAPRSLHADHPKTRRRCRRSQWQARNDALRRGDCRSRSG